MPSNLLSTLPKHVFISQEFDFYRRDTLEYIGLLQQHNKVLDVLCPPGGSHISQNSKEDQIKLFEYMHENQTMKKCSDDCDRVNTGQIKIIESKFGQNKFEEWICRKCKNVTVK